MPCNIGQNWLLLRGLSREAKHWGSFIPQLQQAFPNAHIHTLDLPGTGLLHQLNCPANIGLITEFVREQALQQGLLAQQPTLLALSLGGRVGWEWLTRYPADLNGAVLVNTSFASLSHFYQRLRWQSYTDFARILLQRDVYQRELAILQLVSNRRDRDAEIATEWQAIQFRHPISRTSSLRQIMAAARYKPATAKPFAPVMLLNSLGDRLVSPACSRAISDKWALDLYSHPWGGHDLCLDDGMWVVERLQDWSNN